MGDDQVKPLGVGRIVVEPSQLAAQQATRARLGYYTSYLNFGDVWLYFQTSQFVSFENPGNRPLVIQNIQASLPAFQVSTNRLVIPPRETRTVRVSFTPASAQTYSASLFFTTNDPQHSSGTVYMTGRGIAR